MKHWHKSLKHFQVHIIISLLQSHFPGTGDNEQNNLPPGLHKFPFQIQLPLDLPPSFEGAYGFIRYTTKATIDVPWKFDHHTKRAFTVIPELDLKQEPDIGVGQRSQRISILISK